MQKQSKKQYFHMPSATLKKKYRIPGIPGNPGNEVFLFPIPGNENFREFLKLYYGMGGNICNKLH